MYEVFYNKLYRKCTWVLSEFYFKEFSLYIFSILYCHVILRTCLKMNMAKYSAWKHLRNNLCVFQTARVFQSALKDSLLTWRTTVCVPAATLAASRASAPIAETAASASQGSTSRERAAWSSALTGQVQSPPFYSFFSFSLYISYFFLSHMYHVKNELILRITEMNFGSCKKK